MAYYSRYTNLRSKLKVLRNPELRSILQDLNVQRSGRKSDLIERIASTLEHCEAISNDPNASAANKTHCINQLQAGYASIEKQFTSNIHPQSHASQAQSSNSNTNYLPSINGPYNSIPLAPLTPSCPRNTTSLSYSATSQIPSHSHYVMPPQLLMPHPKVFNINSSPKSGYSQAAPRTPILSTGTSQNVTNSSNFSITVSGSAEVLYPITLQTENELNNARCFCPTVPASGKVVHCIQCDRKVHAKCHQLIASATAEDEWYCEVCRSKIFEPFHLVRKDTVDPIFVRFSTPESSTMYNGGRQAHCTLRVDYHINNSDITDIYNHTENSRRDQKSMNGKISNNATKNPWELQLRCFILKEDVSRGNAWPPMTQLGVNNISTPLVQRAPVGQANPSKVLRELPQNLSPYINAGRNTLDIRTPESSAIYCFMVQIVEIRNIDELILEVKERSKQLTYEDAKLDVMKSFNSNSAKINRKRPRMHMSEHYESSDKAEMKEKIENGVSDAIKIEGKIEKLEQEKHEEGEVDDDDDDGIMMTSTILSTRCPLGLGVIQLPARGINCSHLQCFDLKTFLQFNRKARSKPYICTICFKFILVQDLRIDPYLMKLLEDVAAEDDDELDEVEILPDASWLKRTADKIKTESARSSKRVKVEGSDTSFTRTNEKSTDLPWSSQSNGDGSSADAPLEIDLSLSSDEDDDHKNISTKATQTIFTPSNITSNGNTNGEDDIMVFTVDSDLWETMPVNTATGNDCRTTLVHDSNSDLNTTRPIPLHVNLSMGSSQTSSQPFNSSQSMPIYQRPLNSATNASTWQQNQQVPYFNNATYAGSQYSSPRGSWSHNVSHNNVQQSAGEVEIAGSIALLSRNHSQDSDPYGSKKSSHLGQISLKPINGSLPGVAPLDQRRNGNSNSFLLSQTDMEIQEVINLLDSDDDNFNSNE